MSRFAFEAETFVKGAGSYIGGAAAGALTSKVAGWVVGEVPSADMSSQINALFSATLEAGLLFTMVGFIAPRMDSSNAFFFTVGALQNATVAYSVGQAIAGLVASKF